MSAVADGQLGAVASPITFSQSEQNRPMSITFFNTGGGANLVTIQVKRKGSTTYRTLTQLNLQATGESGIVRGLALGSGDSLQAYAANANQVNYWVQEGNDDNFGYAVYDANGSIKQKAA